MESLKFVDQSLLAITAEQTKALLPYLIMLSGALITIVFAMFRGFFNKWVYFFTLILVSILGVYACISIWGSEPVTVFGKMFVVDSVSNYFNVLFFIILALTTIPSLRYLDKQDLQYPEYYILLLFSALGMMLMASSTELITLFVSLEIMSLAVYVLVGFRRADRKSNEASVKYFILGAAASAILLYGAALVYGSTGTTAIPEIISKIKENPKLMTPLFHLGSWLLIAGFLFKVASVPFHMWMPDVYEGAPTPITGFMTTGVKAASFAAFIRVFVGLDYGDDRLLQILWIIAVLTMFIGNVIALTQTNLKRMLAYSSIAHTGYLLVGMIAAAKTNGDFTSVGIYLFTYSVMNLGAFAILSVLSTRGDYGLNIQDLSGLSKTNPWLAFSMAVFLFSMAGIPPTAGFAAKYFMFYSAIEAKEYLLVVLAVLCSAISVYYYLRVLVFMYMRDRGNQESLGRISSLATFAVAMAVTLTLQVGLLPSKIIEMTQKAFVKNDT